MFYFYLYITLKDIYFLSYPRVGHAIWRRFGVLLEVDRLTTTCLDTLQQEIGSLLKVAERQQEAQPVAVENYT